MPKRPCEGLISLVRGWYWPKPAFNKIRRYWLLFTFFVGNATQVVRNRWQTLCLRMPSLRFRLQLVQWTHVSGAYERWFFTLFFLSEGDFNAIRFRASDCYFSIWKKDRSSYAIRIAKSEGMKSDLRIRWRKSSDIGCLLCDLIPSFWFTLRSEKEMGLLMQSDFAKSDGIKSDLRIRWPSRQILAQNPTTRPIGLSNRKMASVFNRVKI